MVRIHWQQTLQKFIGFFLLIAISFLIIPKELIHELHHHTDTLDVVCMDACKEHISEVHQHCEILQLTTPQLYHHVGEFSFNPVFLPFNFLVENTTAKITERVFSFYLRGPPSLS